MKSYEKIYIKLCVSVRVAGNALTSPGVTTFAIVCGAITAVLYLI